MLDYNRSYTDRAINRVDNAKAKSQDIPTDINKASLLSDVVKVSGLEFLSDPSYPATVEIISKSPSVIRKMKTELEYSLIIECLDEENSQKLIENINLDKISPEVFFAFAKKYGDNLVEGENLEQYKPVKIEELGNILTGLGFEENFTNNIDANIFKNVLNEGLYYTEEGSTYMANALVGMLGLFGLKIDTGDIDISNMPTYDQRDYEHVSYMASNLKDEGCGALGVVALACVYTGKTYTPEECVELLKQSGYKPESNLDAALKIAELVGFSVEEKEISDIITSLDEGKGVLTLMNGSSHFVSAVDLNKEGKVVFYDSYFKEKEDLEGRNLSISEYGYLVNNDKNLSGGSIWVFDYPEDKRHYNTIKNQYNQDYVFAEPSQIMSNSDLHLTVEEERMMAEQFLKRNNIDTNKTLV